MTTRDFPSYKYTLQFLYDLEKKKGYYFYANRF